MRALQPSCESLDGEQTSSALAGGINSVPRCGNVPLPLGGRDGKRTRKINQRQCTEHVLNFQILLLDLLRTFSLILPVPFVNIK